MSVISMLEMLLVKVREESMEVQGCAAMVLAGRTVLLFIAFVSNCV